MGAAKKAAPAKSGGGPKFKFGGGGGGQTFAAPAGRYTSILPSFLLKTYGQSESGMPDMAALREAGYTGGWGLKPPKKIKVVNPDAGIFGRIFIQPKIDEEDNYAFVDGLTKLEKELISKGQVNALTGPA